MQSVTLPMYTTLYIRGVDKFVRVRAWDVVKCIYANILPSKYNV